MSAIDFLAKNAQAVGLDDEVKILAAIGEVAKRWKANPPAANAPHAVIDFLRMIVEAPTNPVVEATFNALGLVAAAEAATLRNGLAAFAGKGENFLRRFGPLLEPVNRYDESAGSIDEGLVEFKLPALAGTVPAGPVSLDLSASAAMEIEGGAWWRYSDADMQKGKPFLRIGFNGKTSAKAGVKLPFQYGSVGIGAADKREMLLDYYFETPLAKQGQPLGIVAAQNLEKLANPFDFNQLARAMTDGDLAGIVIRPKGVTTLTVSAIIGADFEIFTGLEAAVKLAIDASVTVATNYNLSLRRVRTKPGLAPDILAVLSRDKLTEASLAKSLKIDLDASALIGRVHQILVKYAELSERGLATITPFLTPGTWLRTKAVALVREKLGATAANAGLHTPLKAAIERDATAFFGVTKAGGVADWLIGEVTTAIDRVETILASKQADAVQAATGAVVALLGERHGALVVEAVKTELEPRIKELIDRVVDAFETEAKKLVGAAAAPIKKLVEDVGGKVSAAADAADKALANVREIVAKYQAAVALVLDKTGEGLNAHIALSLAEEERRWSGTGYQIAGTFRPGVAGAAAIYQQLLHGDLDRVLAGSDAAFVIDAQQSRVTRVAGGSRKRAFDFMLFGLKASGSVLLKGEAESVTDAVGNVVVVSRGDFERKSEGFRESVNLKFFDIIAIAANAALVKVGALPVAKTQIGFGLAYDDERLSRGEADSFLASLKDGGLIDDAQLGVAKRLMQDWFGAGVNGTLKTSFSATLDLSPAQIAYLMQYAKFAVTPDAVDYRALHFKNALTALQAQQVFTAKYMEIATTIAQKHDWTGKAAAKIEGNLYPALHELVVWLGGSPGQRSNREQVILTDWGAHHGGFDQADIEFTFDMLRLAMGFVQFITKLGEIQRAAYADWTVEDYRAAQLALVATLDDWLRVKREAIFWLDPRVSPHTRAFLSALLATVNAAPGVQAPRSALAVKLIRRNASGPDTVAVV